MAVRCQAVLDRARPTIEEVGMWPLVAHGHVLRILTAQFWVSPPIGVGCWLDASGISVLGHERVQPVIAGWNISPDGLRD